MTSHNTSSRPLQALEAAIDRARGVSVDTVSQRALESAGLSLLDWLGCAVAGSGSSAALQTRAALGPSEGSAAVIGTSFTTSWRDAVLLNGVHGHVLDFDDMLPAMSGHPSAAVLPAVLTLGARMDATVEQILESMVAGVEMGAWVAQYLMPAHYDAGWHGTGTIGVFASAGAVSHLLGLTMQEWVSAMDLAATQASGLRELFGTSGKPLHAGNAAQSGAMASLLAQSGAGSRGQGLMGGKGFIAIHGGDPFTSNTPADTSWAIEGMLYKNYASCYMTQAAVDAALSLRSTVASMDEISSILITASPKLRDVCAIPDPRTDLEAKFSLQATLALALLGHDMADEKSYSQELLNETGYQALRSRTQLAFDEGLTGSEPRIIVEAALVSGEKIVLDIDRGKPVDNVVALESALRQKFSSLVAPVLGAEKGSNLADLAARRDTKIAVLLAASMQHSRKDYLLEPAVAG